MSVVEISSPNMSVVPSSAYEPLKVLQPPEPEASPPSSSNVAVIPKDGVSRRGGIAGQLPVDALGLVTAS
jgi:hypothetical protein